MSSPDARRRWRHCAEICIASEEVQEGTAETVLYLEHGTVLIRLEFWRKQVASIGGIRFLLYPSLPGISLSSFLFRFALRAPQLLLWDRLFGPVPFHGLVFVLDHA